MAKIQKQDAKDILKTAGILGIICFIAVLLLSGGNMLTKDKIEMHKAESTINAQKKILTAESYTNIDENIVEAKDKDVVVGYFVTQEPEGFGGKIEMLIGIKKDGTVAGIEIISMSETPGLGANATKEAFKEKFKGQMPPLSVVKTADRKAGEIDAMTSATVTTKAVVAGVNDAVELLKEAGLIGEGAEQ